MPGLLITAPPRSPVSLLLPVRPPHRGPRSAARLAGPRVERASMAGARRAGARQPAGRDDGAVRARAERPDVAAARADRAAGAGAGQPGVAGRRPAGQRRLAADDRERPDLGPA